MATVTVALLLLLTVDAIAVTAVDCCWLLMLLLLLLLTTPERDSFKINDPSRVFSKAPRDPSTPRAVRKSDRARMRVALSLRHFVADR